MSCASACNRIATLRTYIVSSPVTVPTASSCFSFHASNALGILLDCSDGRIPHGSVRTAAEIRTRDPSILAVTWRWLRNR